MTLYKYTICGVNEKGERGAREEIYLDDQDPDCALSVGRYSEFVVEKIEIVEDDPRANIHLVVPDDPDAKSIIHLI
jgi:hypothetical protein